MGIDVLAKECDFEGQNIYSYSASLEKNSSSEFTLTGQLIDPKNPQRIFIHGCKEAVLNKKSLLITLAPLEFGIEITRSSSEYAKEIRPENCSIENNSFEAQTFEEKLENNRKKLKFINKCVDINIIHTSTSPLNIKEDENCRINRISSHEVVARGGRCLVDIYPDSNYEISYKINKNCQDLISLKDLGLNPMEYLTRAVFYTLETNNTSTGERLLVGNSMIRFNVEPSTSQGDLSIDVEEKGTPVYFTKYPVPSVDLGSIKVNPQRGYHSLGLEIFADNRCKKQCSDGVCSSPCDYTVPLVGMFSLYEVKSNGKKAFLKEWYDGSAIPGNFQGLIPLQDLKVSEFLEEGKSQNLVIEVTFSDPKYEYQLFKKTLKGLLPPLPGIPTVGFHANLNSGFSGFSATGTLNPIPSFNIISEFTGSNPIGSLNSFETLTKSTHWPAEFEMICNRELEKCQKISSQPFLKFIINFKISKNGDQVKLENLKIERKSNILTNYIKTGTDTPRIQCI